MTVTKTRQQGNPQRGIPGKFLMLLLFPLITLGFFALGIVLLHYLPVVLQAFQ